MPCIVNEPQTLNPKPWLYGVSARTQAQVVRMLLDAGARRDLCNFENDIALDLAFRHAEVRLLLQTSDQGDGA